jgi:predicted nucleotidyltransferase/DNA-binding XRE family transcriptional regulator
MNAPDLIKEGRRRAGMTQAALAAAAGLTQPVVSAYEAGRRQPTLPTLLHILHAAGFDLGDDLRPVPRPVGVLARHRRQILAEADRHGAERVRVFGSIARGDATDDSDIDLLVRFRPNVTLLGLARLQVALVDLLGVPVDVVSEDGLREDDSIAAEAVPL